MTENEIIEYIVDGFHNYESDRYRIQCFEDFDIDNIKEGEWTYEAVAILCSLMPTKICKVPNKFLDEDMIKLYNHSIERFLDEFCDNEFISPYDFPILSTRLAEEYRTEKIYNLLAEVNMEELDHIPKEYYSADLFVNMFRYHLCSYYEYDSRIFHDLKYVPDEFVNDDRFTKIIVDAYLAVIRHLYRYEWITIGYFDEDKMSYDELYNKIYWNELDLPDHFITDELIRGIVQGFNDLKFYEDYYFFFINPHYLNEHRLEVLKDECKKLNLNYLVFIGEEDLCNIHLKKPSSQKKKK